MTFSKIKTGLAITTLAHAILAFAPAVTPADARPSTQRFSCDGLQDYIEDIGTVVMNTKNNRVYNRLVANRSYCEREKRLYRVSVPTRDGICRVFTCREALRNKR